MAYPDPASIGYRPKDKFTPEPWIPKWAWIVLIALISALAYGYFFTN